MTLFARAGALALLLAGLSFPGLGQTCGERDTDFRVTLRRTEGSRSIDRLHLRSTATYPCEGYRILTTTLRRGDTILVSIGGLLRPSPCFSTLDEAEAETALEGLPARGFVLIVAYRDCRDTTVVNRTSRGMAVLRSSSRFTQITVE